MPPAPLDPTRDLFAQQVRDGLGSTPKFLEPVYFYDKLGSELFEEITRQPEYYVTRTEAELLKRSAPDLAEAVGKNINLVELGSGSSAKTTIVLESFLETRDELHYLPIDVSRTMVTKTADWLDHRYPELSVTPIVSEYEPGLERASILVAEDTETPDRVLVMFLGSSIGNMEPKAARQFVHGLRGHLTSGDALLIGFDLQKDEAVLHAAYNDAAGVTERFNLNILTRINRELGGEFDLERFEHHAFYNRDQGRIEMHLRSQTAQDVRVAACDTTFHFAAGETIHTESSYKYVPEWIEALASDTGFRVQERFTDDNEWFSLALFAPV